MAKIAFDPQIPVFDRHAKSFPKHATGEPATYGPFSEACSTIWEWDAHFAAYACPKIERRLGTQASLAYKPKMVLLVLDVDAPDHRWTPEWWAREKEKVRALFKARGRGYCYTTRGGYRIVMGLRDELELAAPADALRWRYSYLDWIARIRVEFGIECDLSCADWTRCFRLPRVSRDGAPATPADELGEADRMLEWREPYVAADDPRVLRVEAPIEVPEPAPIDEDNLGAAVFALAEAWPKQGRHRASLALCGALAKLGWSDEAIADFVHAVCYFAVDKFGGPPVGPEAGFEKRLAQARSSAEKVARGEDVAGWGVLEQMLEEGAPREALTNARRALGCGPAIELFAAARAAVRPAVTATDAASVRALLAAPHSTVPIDPIAQAAFESQIAEAKVEAADVDFTALLDDVATALPPMIEAAESKSRTVDARPMGMTYREMRARNLPPPEYLIDGLIPKEGVGALAGEPKAAKSWDATYFGVCVASGRTVFERGPASAAAPAPEGPPGFAVQRPAGVFYYYAEDIEGSVTNRIRAIATSMGLDPTAEWSDRLVSQPRGRPIDVMNTAQLCVLAASVRLHQQRSGQRFALLILDPLSNIHSGEEDKRDSMVKVMARLHAIEQFLGLAILFVHHSGKENKENKGRTRGGQKMRGSSAVHGAVDFGIYLSHLRGDKKNEFIARVESEMKAARGAGTFDRVLKIEDNEKGNAIRAAFSAAEAQIDDKSGPQDLVEQRAMLVVAKLFEQNGPLTFDQLKVKIKGGQNELMAAIHVAEVEGWVQPKYHGARRAGYEITEKGRELYRSGGGSGPASNEGGGAAPPGATQDPALAGFATVMTPVGN